MKQPSRKNPKRMLTHFALAGMAAYEKHQDHVFILGAITIQWSTTERLLFECFRFLLQMKRTNAEEIYNAVPSFRMRRRLLEDLILELLPDSETKRSVLKLLKGVQACAQQRNRLVHDTWMIDSRSNSVVHQLMGDVAEGKEDIITAPLAQLTALHQKMHDLNLRLSIAIVPLAMDRTHTHAERMEVLRKLAEKIDRPPSVARPCPPSSPTDP